MSNSYICYYDFKSRLLQRLINVRVPRDPHNNEDQFEVYKMLAGEPGEGREYSLIFSHPHDRYEFNFSMYGEEVLPPGKCFDNHFSRLAIKTKKQHYGLCLIGTISLFVTMFSKVVFFRCIKIRLLVERVK